MALPAPVAYWPFNEATGTTAADASGNGHTATLNHGAWDTTTQKFGAAALKNTAGGYGASFASINLGTVHTVAFWMNGWNDVTSNILVGDATTNFYACFVAMGPIRMFYSAGSGNFQSVAVGASLAGSHHVTIVRNGTALTFYRDGVSVGTATLPSNTALTLSVLSGAGDNSNIFAGTLDDVRLYNVALTGGEVAELFALNPDLGPSLPHVTQAAIETLSLPFPAARVTQAIVETLSAATVSTPQLTQAVLELLSQGLATVPDLTGLTLAEATAVLAAAGFTLGTTSGDLDGFVTDQSPDAGTQAVPGSSVDLVLALPPAIPHVTQAVVELLTLVPTVRVTQALLELLTPSDPIPVRLTQLAVDVFQVRTIAAATTQLAVEVFRTQPATTRATQLVVEVFLVPGPCIPGFFPVDDVAAGGSCPAGLLP